MTDYIVEIKNCIIFGQKYYKCDKCKIYVKPKITSYYLSINLNRNIILFINFKDINKNDRLYRLKSQTICPILWTRFNFSLENIQANLQRCLWNPKSSRRKNYHDQRECSQNQKQLSDSNSHLSTASNWLNSFKNLKTLTVKIRTTHWDR